ncbi:hypothetical protein K2P56_00425 [Patescibacteria group bacterium]|nr:hypothetical protein [Patescibacteria group bacterium]
MHTEELLLTKKVPPSRKILERLYIQTAVVVNFASSGVAGVAISRTLETGNLVPGAIGVGVAVFNAKTLLSIAKHLEDQKSRGE